jgi:dienelactone hydrolase
MPVPKFLSFLSPYIDGDAPVRLIQGLVVGAVATMIIGFSWGGWNVHSTVEQKVESARTAAMVKALVPICVDKFEKASRADNTLVAALGAVDSWQRDDHMMKNGWATFSGEQGPNRIVAEACAKLLSTTHKL